MAFYIIMPVSQKKRTFPFKVCCRLDKLSISDTDLCCLLGNALDNAVTACGRYDGERYITVASEKNQDMLLLTVDNSFDGMILQKKKEKNPLPVSEKMRQESVSALCSRSAKKYNGISRFEAAESQFEARFYDTYIKKIPDCNDISRWIYQ